MKIAYRGWLAGLVFILILIAVPIAYFARPAPAPNGEMVDDPWAGVPRRPAHVDHGELFEGPFRSGPEVTRACLGCHEDAAAEIMGTAHWRWQSELVLLEGRAEPAGTVIR